MRVALVSSYAESLTNFRGPLIRELVTRGHEVFAFAPDFCGASRMDVEEFGAKAVGYALQRRGANPFAEAWSLGSLARQLRRVRPSFTVAYTIKPVLYTPLATLGCTRRCGAIITGRGQVLAGDNSQVRTARGLRVLYEQALRRTERVIFQNRDDLDFFYSQGWLDRVSWTGVVPGSGVDIDKFTPAPLPGQTGFLMLSRLLVSKGVHEYVEAARMVKKDHPDVEFRLGGPVETGTDAVRLESVRGWEDEGTITYLGQLGDVRPALRNTSAYVLPSYYGEGLPRSVLEAMATGRAVVTANTTGCRETVDQGRNGWVVPPKDPRALARALAWLVENPDECAVMGDRSREKACTEFESGHIARQTADLLGL